MRYFLGLFIIFTFSFLVYAIHDYMTKYGSLTGEIVFELPESEPALSAEGMNVFLISILIEPYLDSLKVYYRENIEPLEDTVAYYRKQEELYTTRAHEEEVIFNLTAGEFVNLPKVYQENKRYLAQVIAEQESLKALYDQNRDQLVDLQTEYNHVIADLIDDKVLYKAEVDENGHFEFKKVPNDDFYLYALRIFSGGIDITVIPADMYNYYALTGEPIRKFLWMVKVSVDEETYLRLDKSNQSSGKDYLFK